MAHCGREYIDVVLIHIAWARITTTLLQCGAEESLGTLGLDGNC